MYMSRLPKLSLLVLAFVAGLDYATLSPVNDVSSGSELNDLNKTPVRSKTRIEQKTESSSFIHYDEDSLRLVADLNEDQKLKYDVEVLEVRNVNKETDELEERFRGPAIKMDTDNFVAENIEMNGGSVGEGVVDDDDDDKSSHIILTMVLVFVALFSISLYVALVIWRSNLERRYGMRELLVTSDDEVYLPSSDTMDRRW
ncbi:uncharacterized protein LOC129235540 [Anastrepha obliqua]|uniref:uncharacterized protein LOC129235540 n=1 Tax=Anastrepha obliqua TaxID=95512 RepID=UPI00240A671A|nr:uncharacterized protein LOC129235540 [Anastrepha obliqua]